MKQFILFPILFILIAINGKAQTHVCPEQVALEHLDLLVQADTLFSDVKFYADGHFFEAPIDGDDTLTACYKNKESNCNFANPFKGKILKFNDELKKFPVNKKLKQNSKYPILEVHRALERGDKYVVIFGISTSVFIKTVIILTLDHDGNLIKKCLSKINDDEN
ncbi:MAG TPA: hypothetical protein VNZ49_05375 [Bacteroidia bacterium]|jgi:hypothetical protein|nr:hypothetical protein [Bacteroidia bacterium]